MLVHVCASEAEMLRAWHAHFMSADPDALAVYEVSNGAATSCQQPQLLSDGCSTAACLCQAKPEGGEPAR